MYSKHLPIYTIGLLINKMLRLLKFLELRSAGAKIGKSVQTYGPFFEGNPAALVLGDGTRIRSGARLVATGAPGSLDLGKNTFVNHGVFIDCRNRISIGDCVAIGPNTYVTDFDHSFEMNENGNRLDIGISAPVAIGENVWIGANACILKGVKIGARSVIGAGAVVTESIPADSLAVGNPAKVIRQINRSKPQH